MPHKETRKFLSDTGTMLIRKAKEFYESTPAGKYGKKMETRFETPEGEKLRESLKTKGFWKTLKESKNK